MFGTNQSIKYRTVSQNLLGHVRDIVHAPLPDFPLLNVLVSLVDIPAVNHYGGGQPIYIEELLDEVDSGIMVWLAIFYPNHIRYNFVFYLLPVQ